MEKNLRTIGISFEGKPLNEYFKDEVEKQASIIYSEEIKRLNDLVKHRPKLKAKSEHKYNEAPSKCRKWTKEEIIRRNFMEEKNYSNLPAKGTKIEKTIVAMQYMEENSFTPAAIYDFLSKKYDEKIHLKDVYSRVSFIYKAIGDNSDNYCPLIHRERLDGRYFYTTSEEFRQLPAQVICKIINDFYKQIYKSKKRVKNSKSNYGKKEVQNKEVEEINFSPELYSTENLNLIEIVQELRPRSIIMQDPDGALTIIVM